MYNVKSKPKDIEDVFHLFSLAKVQLEENSFVWKEIQEEEIQLTE